MTVKYLGSLDFSKNINSISNNYHLLGKYYDRNNAKESLPHLISHKPMLRCYAFHMVRKEDQKG